MAEQRLNQMINRVANPVNPAQLDREVLIQQLEN